MPYALFADLLVAVHVGYVGFVLVGQLLIVIGGLRRWRWIRNAWFRLIHLLMIAIVVFEAAFGITCPLTRWEHQLRAKAGQPVEEASFMGRLLHELIFIEDVPHETFTVAYCIFGALVVASLAVWPPIFRRNEPK